MVLRKVVGTTKNQAWGKLVPNWEGPYRVTLVVGIGTYYLEDLDKNVIPCLWNVNNLRCYYYQQYEGFYSSLVHLFIAIVAS